ncbi:hypothetical protein LI177_08775 [bacterium 210820-DFI.6.37]|nr:hypothetical protein [bacterium 210820-DFI.6.37]
MNRYLMEFNMEECSELAHEIFMRTSGINKDGPKFERMRKDAFRMRKVIEDRIKIRATCAYYDDVEITGNKAIIGGKIFRCSAFDQLRQEYIKGAYIYALSVGDFGFPEEPILDQLYADIWGSAFTDAARILMRKKLEENAKLSDSFGPGFYGMDVSEIGTLTSMLNMDELDIEVKANGIMVPLKSCAGLYFSVDERYQKLNQACETCMGTHLSCKLCQVYGGIN